MEVPVQLQTAAFVLVDGLDGHVKKVWTFFTYIVDHILSWHCPCLWIILLAVCMCGKFGRERKCSACTCHVTVWDFSSEYFMGEIMDGTISLYFVFSFCSKAICSETCQNGGTCSSPDTCSCVHGWTGSTCSEGLWNVCRP